MSNMIPKWITEDLIRYTFVKDARIKGTYLYIDYIVDGDIKTKKIARRTTLGLLQKILADMKEKVGEKNEEVYRGNYYVI